MKKKIVCLLPFLALGLFACGGNPTSSVTPSSQPVSSSIPAPSSETPSSQPATMYSVKFMVDGQVVSTLQVEKGKKITNLPTDPVKEGYEFIGWFKTAECKAGDEITKDTVVDADLTAYAGFEELPPVEHTVTFDANGGVLAGEATATVIDGNKVTKPGDPSYEGNTFTFWSLEKGGTEFDFTTPVTASFTLYANWEEIPIIALYDIEASSELNRAHRADAAADGDPLTYWSAANCTEKQTLLIDLEEVQHVTKVSQTFNDIATWTFTIFGSIDGELWLPILDKAESGAAFEASLNGLFRYVKLEVPAGDNVATSVEFAVDSESLADGLRVNKAFKGLSDCHASGCEDEKAFDGDLNTMFCPASDHVGHYMGMELLDNTFFYATKVVIHTANTTSYDFMLDYKDRGGNWPVIHDNTGSQDINNVWSYPVDDEVNAVLYHQTAIGSNWHGILEFELFGYENLSNAAAKVAGEAQVYDLGALSRVELVKVLATAEGQTLEISNDGIIFEEIEIKANEKGFVEIGKEARYVRYADNSGAYGDSLLIYGTKFEQDLALGITPTCPDTTLNPNVAFGPEFTTRNPSCKQASGYFYCHKDYEGLAEFNFDLGKAMFIDRIIICPKDAQTNETIKLKVEIKVGDEYVTVYNSFDAPVAGASVVIPLENVHMIQNIRVTGQLLGTWTNFQHICFMGYSL